MNKLPLVKRAQILGLLVEGNSLRAASRLADVSINTVTKLLVDLGKACSEYQDKALRNLTCKRLQLDEIWSFVYAKQKNVPENKKGSAGDIWTWTAIDADTKLIASWMVGDRSGDTARIFVADLASRLANRVQITTDGHRVYLDAVDAAFGIDVDYAMLEKKYASHVEGQKRYSPPVCVGAEQRAITGRPDKAHISTSFAERQNLTMRMSMRRFTRLTNAFSKKAENHAHAIAVHFMYYNFGRIHKTLRITPAMAAGVTDHVWSLEEILGLSN
ncbi:MAG: IS1 family transposase [Alphaproteobacteria bacterium]